MAVFILKVFICFLLCFLNFYQEDVRKAAAAEDLGVINIGVILDQDWYGNVTKTAFELAEEDVNKENKLPNSSRLVLQFRFSGHHDGGNAVMAASAAADLLKSQEVVAIIGPQTSQEAGFVIDLCNASKVPMVSFSATDPLLSAHRYPYFIRLPHSDAVQADAIAALVQYYGWREVVAVYADNDYGTGVLPFLRESLSNVGCEIVYRSAIPANANRIEVEEKLRALKRMQTRIFVVHVTSELGTIFFSEAQRMGMMTRDYAWIITEGFSAVLDVLDESSIASMQGVLGTKSYIPNSNELRDFGRRWKPRFMADNPQKVKPVELNLYAYYAYDAVRMIAKALQGFDNAKFNFSLSPDNPNESNNSPLSKITVFQEGERLLQLLGNTNSSGLTGQLQVSEGEIVGATYEILNVFGKGKDKSYRPVGYWTKENGFRQLENVTWPGGHTDPPRGWATPTNITKMRIAVPVKSGFREFVRTENNTTGHGLVVSGSNPGFVIEMFEAVLKNLSYDVPHEFIPYDSRRSDLPGYYDDIVQQVFLKEFDAAVGDFTILAKRSELVDFTQPYYESGLVMVVPIKEANPTNAWTFILPFTPGMWSTTGAFFVFTGIVVWLLEHKLNDTFRGKPKEQVTTLLWYSFSTLFFAQREKVVSSLARGVIIIWLFVVLILQSSYTANLTAILTAKQLQPTIQDVDSLKSSGKPVGYNAVSFVDDYLVDHLGIDRTKLKAYSTPQEYAEALSNESVAAIFDELPYICVFMSEYRGFTIVGQTYRTGGLGFVFPKRSPMVSDMSTSVLEVLEGPENQKIRQKYFKNTFKNTDCSYAGPQANSNRLSMKSFWGLFLITGSASAICLFIYLGRLVYQYVEHRLTQEQQQFPSTKQLISSRLKSFLSYMDEKKASDKSAETSQESDQSPPDAPNFGNTISTMPAGESPVSVTIDAAEEDDNESTVSSGSWPRSSSFSLPEATWTESPLQNLNHY